MRRPSRFLPVLALLLLAIGCSGSPRQAETSPSSVSVAPVSFERLSARLAGVWAMLDENGAPLPDPALTSRMTANGSALVERIFPGQPHEMVSVYHRDGDAVVLTHYCALGNAPHMVLAPESTEDRWVFVCDEQGSNFDEAELHMHRGVLTWEGEDRFRSAWTTHEGGVAGGTVEFDAVRLD
ncbi:MAG: hypothetical protein ACO4CW_02940 [Planctomycetota bacterium]|jgi:hypothetical protein